MCGPLVHPNTHQLVPLHTTILHHCSLLEPLASKVALSLCVRFWKILALPSHLEMKQKKAIRYATPLTPVTAPWSDSVHSDNSKLLSQTAKITFRLSWHLKMRTLGALGTSTWSWGGGMTRLGGWEKTKNKKRATGEVPAEFWWQLKLEGNSAPLLVGGKKRNEGHSEVYGFSSKRAEWEFKQDIFWGGSSNILQRCFVTQQNRLRKKRKNWLWCCHVTEDIASTSLFMSPLLLPSSLSLYLGYREQTAHYFCRCHSAARHTKCNYFRDKQAGNYTATIANGY